MVFLYKFFCVFAFLCNHTWCFAAGPAYPLFSKYKFISDINQTFSANSESKKQEILDIIHRNIASYFHKILAPEIVNACISKSTFANAQKNTIETNAIHILDFYIAKKLPAIVIKSQNKSIVENKEILVCTLRTIAKHAISYAIHKSIKEHVTNVIGAMKIRDALSKYISALNIESIVSKYINDHFRKIIVSYAPAIIASQLQKAINVENIYIALIAETQTDIVASIRNRVSMNISLRLDVIISNYNFDNICKHIFALAKQAETISQKQKKHVTFNINEF